MKETGTGWVIKITDPAKRNRIYVASITGVEVVSAIARRARNGDMSEEERLDAIAQFAVDFESQYRVLETTSELIIKAMLLAVGGTLRGYDAVQLAAVLEVNDRCLDLSIPAPTLVSADKALNAAAGIEGLAVDDPNVH